MILIGAIILLVAFFGTMFICSKIADWIEDKFNLSDSPFLPICLITYVMEIAIGIQIILSSCE
jgi:hypothetical protein